MVKNKGGGKNLRISGIIRHIKINYSKDMGFIWILNGLIRGIMS